PGGGAVPAVRCGSGRRYGRTAARSRSRRSRGAAPGWVWRRRRSSPLPDLAALGAVAAVAAVEGNGSPEYAEPGDLDEDRAPGDRLAPFVELVPVEPGPAAVGGPLRHPDQPHDESAPVAELHA